MDDVSFNAGASSSITVPVTWGIEQYVGTQTPDGGIEGYLSLYDASTVVWTQIDTTATIPLAVPIPAATFPAAGIHRARLDVFDSVFNSHTSYQYFTILS